MTKKDAINPPHYKTIIKGVEIQPIDVIEAREFGFNCGNALKYLWRAGLKTDDVTEDLKKARWYLDREISTREALLEKECPPQSSVEPAASTTPETTEFPGARQYKTGEVPRAGDTVMSIFRVEQRCVAFVNEHGNIGFHNCPVENPELWRLVYRGEPVSADKLSPPDLCYSNGKMPMVGDIVTRVFETAQEVVETVLPSGLIRMELIDWSYYPSEWTLVRRGDPDYLYSGGGDPMVGDLVRWVGDGDVGEIVDDILPSGLIKAGRDGGSYYPSEWVLISRKSK
jgi:Protein of unknwon function (DUF3310)